jgi:hypothetical protein
MASEEDTIYAMGFDRVRLYGRQMSRRMEHTWIGEAPRPGEDADGPRPSFVTI